MILSRSIIAYAMKRTHSSSLTLPSVLLAMVAAVVVNVAAVETAVTAADFESTPPVYAKSKSSLITNQLQRFSDLPECLGQAIFSVKPGNSLNPKILLANMSLGLQKYSVKPGIPLKTIPVNPKISVYVCSNGNDSAQEI